MNMEKLSRWDLARVGMKESNYDKMVKFDEAQRIRDVELEKEYTVAEAIERLKNIISKTKNV